MENEELPNFIQREIGTPEGSEESPTKELVKNIEDEQKNAEFLSIIKMMGAYEKEKIMKSFGKKTEEDMKNFVSKNEKTRVEFIPEQLRGHDNEKEYAVYKVLKEHDPDSLVEQKIGDDETERQRKIQERTVREYESLVGEERMKRLEITTKEDVENYKKQNKTPKENIKEVLYFNKNNNAIEESRLYYEIIN